MFPEVDSATVPFLTTEQMAEVDRAMIDDYGILLMQMMENAGRNLAHLARARFFEGSPSGMRVAVLAGVGGNGGGALVSARRLRNWGASVEVCVSKPGSDFADVPRHQLEVIERMGVPCRVDPPSSEGVFDLVVDGLIGYGLSGPPRGNVATLIEWANASPAPILSLDAPSGMDATSGAAYAPAIRATATMTLALPKVGLGRDSASSHVAELYLADIGVPPDLYAALGLDVGPLFSECDIVRLV